MITCISKNLKDILIEELISRDVDDNVINNLNSIPECKDGSQIGFLNSEKAKKPKSRYQSFMSECMRSKNIKKFGDASKAMKECATEWNRLKEG